MALVKSGAENEEEHLRYNHTSPTLIKQKHRSDGRMASLANASEIGSGEWSYTTHSFRLRYERS